MKTADHLPARSLHLPPARVCCLCGVLAVLPALSQAQDSFRIDHVSHFAGMVTLDFTDSRLLADPGMGHALEYSDTLGGASWTYTYQLGTTFAALGGDKCRVTVQSPGARGFYRIGVDGDHDGLSDRMETETFFTNPAIADTDGDGYSDLIELGNGTQPTSNLSRPLRGMQPGVQFAGPTSRAIEGAGGILIPVEFTMPYSGPLYYAVSVMSTATPGSDFMVAASGVVTVTGLSATIPVDILDDLEVEDIEAIVLELHDDAAGAYHSGAFPTHSILVMDNDANWSGLLQSEVGETSFRLRVRRSGAQVSALLVPGAASGSTHLGGQLIPPPPPGSDGWEVTGLTLTATEFTGVSVPLPAGTSRLLGPSPMVRTLAFSAVPPPTGSTGVFYLAKSNDSFGPLVIGGGYTEVLASPQAGSAALQFTNHGYFTLSREAPVMTPLPIPTTPAQP